MHRLLIVTGASSGIGAALAARAAGDGAEVASVSRRPGPGRHLQADLSVPSEWERTVTWIDDAVSAGSHDWVALVHSAATLTPIGYAGEVPHDEYTRHVLLNSASPQVIGDGFLRSMSGRDGVLCVLSSGAARTPYEGWSGYCAGKAAVDQWCRVAGSEQQRRGDRVKVVAVAPGVVDTSMQGEIRQSSESEFPLVDRFRGFHSSGELGDPIDVGRRLWELLVGGAFENGSVLDLRASR
ncbi:MAG: SDR family NAD(P)-dependent oxidoreductase [Acidimicrobiia bacterium]|nr:SDR family NAD(P)-dependent oxidoreductase [Acidimicrobiia bacterium]MDH4306256.1 SDR family NAD(P)-dependent oxidoreductase [Acidimicrobiia bacterium]MDH5292412.1 SDR family NAD(P)-dependent oxidoreductase [Acidimicrobiia bacterium]